MCPWTAVAHLCLQRSNGDWWWCRQGGLEPSPWVMAVFSGAELMCKTGTEQWIWMTGQTQERLAIERLDFSASSYPEIAGCRRLAVLLLAAGQAY